MTVLRGTQGSSSAAPNEILVDGSVAGLGASTLSTIATYNNSSGSKKRIHSIIASGEIYACYYIVVNTVTVVTKRSGPSRNVEFFLNIDLDDGDIIDLKVEHFTTGDTANFEGTILGF